MVSVKAVYFVEDLSLAIVPSHLQQLLKYLGNRWFLNVVFWLAWLAMAWYFNELSQAGRPNSVLLKNFLLELFRFGLPIYLNNLFLLPRLAYKKQTFLYLFLLLLVVVSVTFIHHFLYKAWLDEYWGGFLFYQSPTVDSLGIIVLLLVFTGIQLARDFVKHRENVLELQKLQLQTEMENLKAQVHPHFLFNTLNNLYGLSLQVEHGVLSESILKLSTILRYVLQQEGQELHPLGTEVEVLGNLVDLEKLRHPESEKIELLVEGDVQDWQIAPLILLPLVENSLKYGLSEPKRAGWSSIQISITDTGQFSLNTSNYNPPKLQARSTGLGLKNVQRRLHLLYPDKHQLHINDTEAAFSLTLQMDLT